MSTKEFDIFMEFQMLSTQVLVTLHTVARHLAPRHRLAYTERTARVRGLEEPGFTVC